MKHIALIAQATVTDTVIHAIHHSDINTTLSLCLQIIVAVVGLVQMFRKKKTA